MSSTYVGDTVLDIMSQYAPNRNRSVEKLIRKYIFEKLPKGSGVLEFGAGKGEFILRFISVPDVELLAVETDSTYLNALSAKVKAYKSIDEIPGDLDCIYLVDVLEHIEDDRKMLQQFYAKLKKNGRIFIYVPARMELYSEFDRKIGHYRRYSKDELKSKVDTAGFDVKEMRYHEMLGYFASGANRIFSRSGELNPRAVKFYDSILVPVTNLIERFIRIPVGKSIYLFAKKPN